MAFVAETGSGHLVAMDGAPEGGGRNLAPRPMEMVLLGTGGCTAYDVVMILKKSRQEVAGCSVTLKADRAGDDPKIFTKIHFHFTVTGKDLNPATVERAINLSHEQVLLGVDHGSRRRRNSPIRSISSQADTAGRTKGKAGAHQLDAGFFCRDCKAGR